MNITSCFDLVEVNCTTATVEEVIGRVGNDASGAGPGARAIVKGVPLVFFPVFGIGCVVTTSKTSVMVGDAEQIIDIDVAILLLMEDEGLQIETLNGEVH